MRTIKRWFKNIKFFFQRGKRGWSDRDAWNTDIYLLTIIPQLIGYLRADENKGIPSDFIEKYGEQEGAKQYDAVLSDIQTLFRRVSVDDYENIYYVDYHNSLKKKGYIPKELSDNYWDEQKRLYLVKKNDFNEAWKKLGEVFDSLWT